MADRGSRLESVSRQRVLVVTTDPLTSTMPGPAIRAWHLAEELASEHDVRLVSTIAGNRDHERVHVDSARAADAHRLERWMDVAVVPPAVVYEWPGLARSSKPIAVDVYDPFHLENLEPEEHWSSSEHDAVVRRLVTVVNAGLARADWLCCASERQRDFWIGALASAGRVNPSTYRGDGDLRGLIDIVPFGLPAEAPRRHGPGLREAIDGVGPTDKVVLWGGGVYNWFDPLSLIRAIDLVRRRVPDVRLVFLGMAHPTPGVPKMHVATEARRLAEAMGLAGVHVFFNESWIPYDRRADFLLEADVGVSTHLDHVETRFSFRTRVLDYLWAGLPTVLSSGDALAQLVADAGAGAVVPPGDVAGIADGLIQTLTQPPPAAAVSGLAEQFRWDRVTGPLQSFCRAPHRAADLAAVGRAARLRTTTRSVVSDLGVRGRAQAGRARRSLKAARGRGHG